MIRRILLIALAVLGSAAPCLGEMPYPRNPRPCSAPATPPGCVPATDYSRYLFLPSTTPLTLPNDFGTNNWKLTSEPTGEPAIDSNPQELCLHPAASMVRTAT